MIFYKLNRILDERPKMCSVGDDFEDDSTKTMPQKETVKLSPSSLCNKCRLEKAVVVLRHKDAYCKNCFLTSVVHKFKALLGKHKLIRAEDRVLVYYKTGHPSTALLNFLRTGLDLNTHKKLRFEPVVLFIEDQTQLRVEERQEILRKVKEEAACLGFQFYNASLTNYLQNPSKLNEHGLSSFVDVTENDKEKLYTVLEKKTSKTNKNDLIELFKKQLLVNCAKILNCKFIFTPEISVDIASNLLTNISLGRGCHVPIDTGFCDDRAEVKILRPLRLFDMKELALYNKFNNLEPIYVSRIEQNPYSSVQDLMKKFVNDLQQGFPATVTTIMKTGDKLSLDKNNSDACALCKGPVPKKFSELNSEESTRFSCVLSTTTPDSNLSGEERYRNILEKYENQALRNCDYCYSCSKIKKYIL